MERLQWASALLVVIFLTSCAHEYATSIGRKWGGRIYLEEHYEISRSMRERLATETRIYIPFTQGKGGVQTDVEHMDYLCRGMQMYFPLVDCALRPELPGSALQKAQQQHADYMLWAEVVDWENLNTGWPPTQLEIHATLYHVRSAAVLDVFQIKTRDKIKWSDDQSGLKVLERAYQDLAAMLAGDKIH